MPNTLRSPRARLAIAALALVSTIGLAGCGPKAGTAAGTTSSSVPSSSSSSDTASGATNTSSSTSPCPTTNTRSFAKTRFVADVGLAAGSFHRYIYKPWQAHKFDKGSSGRLLAIAKAVSTAAADAKLLVNATENAKASPALCNAVYGPLTAATTAFDDLKGKLVSGDLTSISGIEAQIQSALTGSTSNGAPVTETTS
ncbi:MAG: hypothetical protein ABI131_07405 [Nostocoides sp.]